MGLCVERSRNLAARGTLLQVVYDFINLPTPTKFFLATILLSVGLMAACFIAVSATMEEEERIPLYKSQCFELFERIIEEKRKGATEYEVTAALARDSSLIREEGIIKVVDHCSIYKDLWEEQR